MKTIKLGFCADCFNNEYPDLVNAEIDVEIKTSTNEPSKRFLCLSCTLAWVGRAFDNPSYVEYVKVISIKEG